jgi:hypothetical protein
MPAASYLRRHATLRSKVMPPTDLNVPFEEKEHAKRLGAKWDPTRKTWFVPDGTERALFTKWLPQQPQVNLRAGCYYLAQSTRVCWHCERNTHVFSFLLPSGHYARVDGEKSDSWEPQDSAVIVFYIRHITPSVQRRMKALSRHYRQDFSKTTQSFYWMNHCEHCGMKQGDFELFEEFDTPFVPIEIEDASKIVLHQVEENFEAMATSMGYEPGFFERMSVSKVGY